MGTLVKPAVVPRSLAALPPLDQLLKRMFSVQASFWRVQRVAPFTVC